MLVDDITIMIKAGDGGNGAVSFKRNAQTAKGGPDGGNGGNGGNVYLQGVDDMLGLTQFRFRKKFLAENGIKGQKQNKYGRNGNDLTLFVPLGTRVTAVKTQTTYEIADTKTKILIARGGIGGRGNNEFKSATNQTPLFAEKGELGEEKILHLELLLIANIGLIGFPNAGKSSLLSCLTNATPKIANYPFTTLEPHLGVLNDLILADIPGLIEGAHTGKGLGITFLRHIEKTSLLLHCIDLTSENIDQQYQTIRNELALYNPSLLKKPEYILLTKSDLVDSDVAKKAIKILKKASPEIIVVSIHNQESINTLKKKLEKFFRTTQSN